MDMNEVIDLQSLRKSNPNIWEEKKGQLIEKIPDIDERNEITLDELKKLNISMEDLWVFQKDFLPNEISVNKSIIDKFVNSIQSRDLAISKQRTLIHEMILASQESRKNREELREIISKNNEEILEITEGFNKLGLAIDVVRKETINEIVNEIIIRKSFFTKKREYTKDEEEIKIFEEIIKELDSLFDFLMYRVLADTITLPLLEKIQMLNDNKE